MTSPVVEQGMAAHLKQRNRLRNMWLHDVSNRLQIRRKALARDAGLDESYDVGTYPSEVVTIEKRGMNPVVSLLLSGLLMATGGGGAIGIASVMGMLDREKPAAVTAPTSATSDQVFDITIEEVGGGQPLKVEAVPVDDSQE